MAGFIACTSRELYFRFMYLMVNVHRDYVKIMQKISPSRVLPDAETVATERESLRLFNHQKYIK